MAGSVIVVHTDQVRFLSFPLPIASASATFVFPPASMRWILVEWAPFWCGVTATLGGIWGNGSIPWEARKA